MWPFNRRKRECPENANETHFLHLIGHIHGDETACVVMVADEPISRADATTIFSTALAINIAGLGAGAQESESLRVHEIITAHLEATRN